MPHADERRPDRRRLPHHPYPLLRVPCTGAFLASLEQQLRASTSWRIENNRRDDGAVVADYIGDAFNGDGLAVAAYDLDCDEPEPSNLISFATLAHRWSRDDKEFHVVSDDDIARAFGLFLPVARDACRKVSVRCRVILPKAGDGATTRTRCCSATDIIRSTLEPCRTSSARLGTILPFRPLLPRTSCVAKPNAVARRTGWARSSGRARRRTGVVLRTRTRSPHLSLRMGGIINVASGRARLSERALAVNRIRVAIRGLFSRSNCFGSSRVSGSWVQDIR
jgi:hypothetical protein